MKQKNENPFIENAANKSKGLKATEHFLYNLLFSGKISLKEYLQEVRKRPE
jgi:hypothetical protein